MPTKSPKVDAYIAKAPDFARPIMNRIRRAMHEASPKIEETIKWGVPYFEYKGLVAGMATFKKHVGFGFSKSKLLSDPQKLFADKPESMCTLKLTTIKDIPSDKTLIAYAKEAVRINEKGVKPAGSRVKRSAADVKVPTDLAGALKKNKKARETFEGLAYSNRKDYVEWLTEAKQETTRRRRLAQAIEWLAEGKPRNWKYMPKYRAAGKLKNTGAKKSSVRNRSTQKTTVRKVKTNKKKSPQAKRIRRK